MKHSKLFIGTISCLMVCIAAVTVYILSTDQIIPAEQLPTSAKAFIQSNYPGQASTFAKKDLDFLGTKYEVLMEDGTKLEFDKDGDWVKIDGNYNPIPIRVIPAIIAHQVNNNYASADIVKIDKEFLGYDVELSNGLELRFNRQGMMEDVDD